jgi:hypothetical protein
VLSVWKLAPGQELYYLEAVAKGVEDYYVGSEAPGQWIASSNHLLGLDGIVKPDALHHVLAGHDLSTGTPLDGIAARKPVIRAVWDAADRPI